ncbi:MAG: hypothetical protein M3Y27_13095 [Acidobacteriota bacterium]|nr:hypothetical protein [Acidobacteriota bacterium]
MTRQRALELLKSDDLAAIGMEADAARAERHPGDIVTYGDEGVGALELIFSPGGDWLSQLDEARQAGTISVKAGVDLMAVDYLKLVAICRLYLEAAHIEVDWRTVGLKVAQLALRFGADDLGLVGQLRNEPNAGVTEEEIRRVIRDAGFVPKRRLAHYGALAVL